MGDMADDIMRGSEPDWLEEKTNGRIYEAPNGKPTCANCESENIKTSKAGNLYCADLCWAKEESKPKYAIDPQYKYENDEWFWGKK